MVSFCRRFLLVILASAGSACAQPAHGPQPETIAWAREQAPALIGALLPLILQGQMPLFMTDNIRSRWSQYESQWQALGQQPLPAVNAALRVFAQAHIALCDAFDQAQSLDGIVATAQWAAWRTALAQVLDAMDSAAQQQPLIAEDARRTKVLVGAVLGAFQTCCAKDPSEAVLTDLKMCLPLSRELTLWCVYLGDYPQLDELIRLACAAGVQVTSNPCTGEFGVVGAAKIDSPELRAWLERLNARLHQKGAQLRAQWDDADRNCLLPAQEDDSVRAVVDACVGNTHDIQEAVARVCRGVAAVMADADKTDKVADLTVTASWKTLRADARQLFALIEQLCTQAQAMPIARNIERVGQALDVCAESLEESLAEPESACLKPAACQYAQALRALALFAGYIAEYPRTVELLQTCVRTGQYFKKCDNQEQEPCCATCCCERSCQSCVCCSQVDTCACECTCESDDFSLIA